MNVVPQLLCFEGTPCIFYMRLLSTVTFLLNGALGFQGLECRNEMELCSSAFAGGTVHAAGLPTSYAPCKIPTGLGTFVITVFF